eukprot:EC121113.1.p2 GENE.EC121113.1~~EC121113.1.p2  ORF type:complete len:112 (+),score=12.24 EC121113.1:164-499(+)
MSFLRRFSTESDHFGSGEEHHTEAAISMPPPSSPTMKSPTSPTTVSNNVSVGRITSPRMSGANPWMDVFDPGGRRIGEMGGKDWRDNPSKDQRSIDQIIASAYNSGTSASK